MKRTYKAWALKRGDRWLKEGGTILIFPSKMQADLYRLLQDGRRGASVVKVKVTVDVS
jgi:hypothetical protein